MHQKRVIYQGSFLIALVRVEVRIRLVFVGNRRWSRNPSRQGFASDRNTSRFMRCATLRIAKVNEWVPKASFRLFCKSSLATLRQVHCGSGNENKRNNQS